MTRICRIALLLLASGLFPPAFAQSPFGEANTKIRLLLSTDAARPGDVVWAGLQMKMPPGWHVYWRNGGDAGTPTQIKWTLPDGVTAGDIQWPLPEKEIDTAGGISLVTYVYTNEVVLSAPLTLSKNLPTGPVKFTASASWMECSDICKPESGDASATMTIGDDSKPSPDAAVIENWRTKVPQPDRVSSAAAYWDVEPPMKDTRGLIFEWKTNSARIDFYPYATTNIQVLGMADEFPTKAGTILRKTIQKSEGEWPKQIDGILVGGIDSAGRFGLEEHLAIQPPTAAAAVLAQIIPPKHEGSLQAQEGSLLTMLALAFLGGLILNVMPCVLPVIALKVLGFVNQSNEEPRRVRRLGGVYGLGVLVSFIVLAGLAITAQRAGGVANWGDAFRNPHFQIAITALMTLIALNLFGVFEITLGGKALGAASELSARPGFPGAFFNGVLATLLATPCTAPFLGVALAFAFTQSPLVIILVFIAAGLGLAFPFVAICFNPRLLKFLPKPGAWMEKFKIAMGFPMIATAVWLVWVSSQTEDDPRWVGLFLVVMALAVWIWGQFVQRGARRKALAVAICLGLIAADYVVVLKGEVHQQAGIDWKVWSPEAVEQAQRAGHPALVDFTAKSCLTCKLNLASSIEVAETRAKLKEIGAVAFKADDTFGDPVIDRELRRHNTSGVPLVLVYSKDPNQPPQVLPTILTRTIVLGALDKAAK